MPLLTWGCTPSNDPAVGTPAPPGTSIVARPEFDFRPVAPIDRERESLRGFAPFVERIVEARIGEGSDIGNRQLESLVDRLDPGRQ